jgi:hypothetical protein
MLLNLRAEALILVEPIPTIDDAVAYEQDSAALEGRRRPHAQGVV